MLERARQIESQLVAWRREFHMHPELGFHEVHTADRVAKELASLNYRLRTGVGRTGVVAERGAGHPVIAIRADMDALPIQEANQVPYASQVPGVMHACGHDAHTAIALGVATLLAQEAFPGTVRFLFQPSEEAEDEQGISGAPRMIEDGAMQGVDAVLALHVDDSIPAGDVTLEAGVSSAGVDTLYATILGQGGHGATPHKTVDPIHIAGHVILALHGIVSRRLSPFDPAVVTIGSIHGGQADNVIPEQVHMTGTIRYMEPRVQQQVHAEIERAMGVARTMGGDYTLKIVTGYPPMVNDAWVVDRVRETAADLLGAEHVQPPEQEMGAEDFAFFSALAPGAMFGLGCRIEQDGGTQATLRVTDLPGYAKRQPHSPRFDIDERCLPIGAGILAEVALRLLKTSEV